MTRPVAAACLVLAALASGCGHPAPAPADGWESLEPGLTVGRFAWCDGDDPAAIAVVRVDPARFDLRVLAASNTPQRQPQPVRWWAERHDLAVATNAGMYHPDLLRHVGLMIDGEHRNNPVAVTHYRSVLAFSPVDPADEPFLLADLDEISLDDLGKRYRTLIQNLRMIDHRRKNVWSQNDRISTAAALGTDSDGNLLFLFSRFPRTVHDLNRCLLELPIGLQRAQYLEGGPEAALVVRSGDTTLEYLGSFSDPSGEPAAATLAWPVPNVVGVVRR